MSLITVRPAGKRGWTRQPEIAEILQLSNSTIGNHKNSAMQKLGISKSSLLTRAAIRLGISSLDDELSNSEMLLLARGRLSLNAGQKMTIQKQTQRMRGRRAPK